MQGYALWALSAQSYGELGDSFFKKNVEQRSVEESENHGDLKSTELVKLENVSFRFPDSSKFLLKEISLTLEIGKIYALVGSSGSGKTTLADICLGLLKPSSGKVITKQGLTLAYVPQQTAIIEGSVLENVALGKVQIPDKLNKALVAAKLEGLDEKISQNTNLSGGQKQRVGIARALYTNANFTVLDEATSALDNSTESEVVSNLSSQLGLESTLLIIAHRLSTIRNVDQIIYLDSGKILAKGTWDELMRSCAPFRESVKIGSLQSEEPEIPE
jgi:ABC-type multidrug transport system fused ATPase/permease subunit